MRGMASIVRAATRPSDEPLRVLYLSCGDAFSAALAATGVRVWAYGPPAHSFITLGEPGPNLVPHELDPDLVVGPADPETTSLALDAAKYFKVPALIVLPTPDAPKISGAFLQLRPTSRGGSLWSHRELEAALFQAADHNYWDF